MTGFQHEPYPYTCPACDADIEMERFDGTCRCWHCGRALRAVHDCVPPDAELGLDGDCYDYAELAEE